MALYKFIYLLIGSLADGRHSPYTDTIHALMYETIQSMLMLGCVQHSLTQS